MTVQYKRDRLRANAYRPLTNSLDLRKEKAVNHATNVETWRTLNGYKGWYQVSDLGRVRSIDRTIMRSNGIPQRRKGKVLAYTASWYGHLRVELPGGYAYVHRLVLETFVGKAPVGTEACHRDSDPTNNELSNLRWADHKSNVADMIEQGRQCQARKTHCDHGHEFTTENTYRTRSGKRACRTCTRIRSRRYRDPDYRPRDKNACARGHEYTQENTYLRPDGGRMCRTCMRASTRRRLEK